jgi:hypothetical protein
VDELVVGVAGEFDAEVGSVGRGLNVHEGEYGVILDHFQR